MGKKTGGGQALARDRDEFLHLVGKNGQNFQGAPESGHKTEKMKKKGGVKSAGKRKRGFRTLRTHCSMGIVSSSVGRKVGTKKRYMVGEEKTQPQ